ncbi:phospholipase D-like domain-containing protein [Candidatus Korobacter versatilis]|nr:phospholipase D-like domain-containing protein [Candidatus Koribacter versatilis]
MASFYGNRTSALLDAASKWQRLTMLLYLLAGTTVSTGFMVIAWLAIAAALLVLFSGLFGPGLRYKISAAKPADNRSDEFLHTLEALTDSKVHRGTSFTVHTNGNDFYEEELRAMAAAQHSINLEAYIFQKSEIAQRYVDTMTERARAGVQVNIVLDAIGSAATHEKFFTDLRQAGGKIAWYNDSTWYKLPQFNHRTHREVLVVDGRVGFIGGAGVADHWYKARPNKPRWRDTMVRVDGEAVPNLQATFAENWLESCGEVLTGEDYFPQPHAEQGSGEAMVINSTPTAGGSTRARLLFQMLLASAQHTIHITTPYFLPDRSMMDELVRAVKERGVEVVLLVPGKKSDHMLTRSSSRRAYGRLLEAAARIYEYQPAMIHAKILLIDGLWGVVGSTNFDNRSFGLNDEVNLAVRAEDFVERLEHDFERDLANSELITLEKWKHRPVLERAPELLGWVLDRQQ